MAGERTQITDAFWQGDIGFVCNPTFTQAALPNGGSKSFPNLHETFIKSGRLPDRGGAPVASWVLARLAALSSKRFPYSIDQITGSDGGNYLLQFVAFTNDVKPLGLLTLTGHELGVQMWAQISPISESDRVVSAFTDKLLDQCTELKRCRLIVVCTDYTDPDLWKKIPFVFGWDGKRFLCERAPEHAVDSEDLGT